MATMLTEMRLEKRQAKKEKRKKINNAFKAFASSIPVSQDCAMDLKNGVVLDDGGVDLVVNVCNGGDVLQENVISEELLSNNGDGINSGVNEVEIVEVVAQTKRLSPVKTHGVDDRGDGLKKDRQAKDQKGIRKNAVAVPRTQRGSLSHSTSFPSKKILTDGMGKSVDGKLVKKPDTKNARAVGRDGEVSVFASLSRPIRRASVPGKSGAVNESANGVASKVSKLHAENSKPVRRSLPVLVKDDEDARSTTSSTTPRASGFSFRLDGRAEKRREFFAKVEEKTHAKEVEKSNLQEKSKESQEADIKLLRKSLTFKATPMPSFYKEPPLKVDLKKVPTTRPISPKLGRHKTSTAVVDKSLEGGDESLHNTHPSSIVDLKSSTKGTQANNNVDSVTLKKSTKRSLSKLPSMKSVNSKTDAKLLSSKAKVRDPQHENLNVQREETENLNKSDENHSIQTEARIELDPVNDLPHENNDKNLEVPHPEIICDEAVWS
ncbi:hypothetical protein GIB67_034365 [Kingdonia uniflora]|uniref:TPX2 C-terminal domain-containing protein n=1 Tax=Kingdonia uniflora TaxID=39325 RepID=A0A7J7NSA3_9MAGN|nr:hypothetical protein GIB67_034365 [Kingdonia uniflora]